MRTRDLLSLASKGVTVNPSRTWLTMLGIIIGVCAVVLMTAVGKSMEGVILGQISSLGPRTIAIFPGKQGPEGGNAALRPDFDALKANDIDALRRLETITSVAPMIIVPGGEARYGRETTDPRIAGADPNLYNNQDIKIDQGRFHDDDDEQSARRVVVLGPDVVEDLFFNENPIGKRIDLAGEKFTVIGTMQPIGTQFLQNVDERIIMPLRTAMDITGRTYADMITVQALDDDKMDLAVADISSLLRQRHGVITPLVGDITENDDFLVRTAAQAQDILGAVSLGLTLFITMVAGISLVVGGIGIMNIMLVAVTERTREIGLRKALGAKRRDVLWQFLAEAAAITLVGGAIGILIGIGLAIIIARIAGFYLGDYAFAVNPGAIVLALLMAGVTGIAFGLYPARKAARLEPISALRYE